MNIDIQSLAGIISISAFGIYIYNIWRGKTRPSRSSWWIITAVWVVLLLSSISLSPGDTFVEKWNNVASNWISLSYIIGSLIIAISSLWRGSSEKWGMFDWLCLVLATASVVVYFALDKPLLSLAASVLADFFGILPTVKNAWKFPAQEHMLAWFLEVVASGLVVFAVVNWSVTPAGVADWISPLYLIIMNGIIMLLVARRYFVNKSR